MNLNHGPTGDDREGFAAFLLRLRGKGVVPKALIAALAIEPGNRVLEIGTGSGYTAAVMSRLAARVVTIDRYKTLVEQAKQRFEALGIGNVIVRQADGSN